MKLNQFIEQFIARNTICRLWVSIPEGHLLAAGPVMEWELLKLPICEDIEVVHITDIVCEHCPEAVNIVVDSPYRMNLGNVIRPMLHNFAALRLVANQFNVDRLEEVRL